MKKVLCMLLACCFVLAVTGCGGDDVSSAPSSTNPSSDNSQPAGLINQDVAAGTITINVDPSVTHQTIEYFGGSGCWVGGVANELSEEQLDEIMDLLYDKEKGIGLTSYRYNIGAGEPINQSWDAVMKRTNCLETAPGEYDLEKDALAISILRKAVERGANVITLFANSPPARMTNSGFTSGALDGSSNLNMAYADEFAKYLVDIADLLADSGIPVTYISPINEPQHQWGHMENMGDQEGCHYELDEILTVGRAVAQEITSRNADYKLSLTESAYWDQFASSVYQQILKDESLLAVMDSFSAHSYGDHITAQSKQSFSSNLEFYEQMNGAKLDLRQTEWCTGNSGSQGAVDMSRAIHEDFTILGCNAWEFWVNMMTDDWSLVKVNGANYSPSVRMWALGNYSKFITGHTRVDCTATGDDDVFASAYVSPDDKTTTVVVTNAALSNKTISFEGTALAGKKARVYETSVLRNLEDRGEMSTDYGYELFFQSVTTFVFDNA